ncbi:hypothetical protein Sya03_59430 [Spirilliplanes yamanashiensis]|uniref:M23ase beta-sheet core domain-containing protein n=1 Tax=Spirilliplanes yamanashiensis TaxID=42233 RepID=A0A8J3YD89_9ACTN|nr:hypothetical protein Sya03_59430 [Spirilliplanes yamanashiensis]
MPLTDYTVTSQVGPRWGGNHDGIDLAAPAGTPVVAAHAGIVTEAGYTSDYGLRVVVDHGSGTTTVYAHSSRLLVGAGQQVRPGDPIALVGETGKAFGPHLHFELRVNGQATDVPSYLAQRGAVVGR